MWIRGLTFWEPAFETGRLALGHRRPAADVPLLARSHFRSAANPRRFALYSLAETPAAGSVLVRLGDDDHTLTVVREFRRVPLRASALSLARFTAQPGRAAAVVATLAHFVERAVSTWEPAYLMLARSVERPCLSVLIAGVHGATALADAAPGTFRLDAVLPELEPMLADRPEIFEYLPDAPANVPALVSPHAV